MTRAGGGGVIARLASGRSPLVRSVAALVGLLVALLLPWFVYPPIALDIMCWALFAMALDLLLGYTGLLSFGHAAFWGSSSYATGLAAIHLGAPFPLAIVLGALAAMALAVPIGWLSVRRTGIYFAMVTLAFAQMLFYLANQWRDVTGGENGLQGIPRELFGLDLADSFSFYYAALPILLLGMLIAWRIVRSPFGRVLVAIRDNPARARALGYPVARYKVMVFIMSAGLSGVAGGVYATSHQFASLPELYWTTSGEVVVMTVLGGIGTLWGSVLGAALIVLLKDYLATAGLDATGIVTGAIFILVVMVFRRGIWGTTAWLLRPPRSGPGAAGDARLSGTPTTPFSEPAARP